MTEKQLQVRVADMHFMLQTTAFVVTLGVLALYMSRIVRLHTVQVLVYQLT